MSMQSSISADSESDRQDLVGARIAVIGKLAGMSRRDAQRLIREHGGVAIDDSNDAPQIIVLGEDELPLAPADWDRQFGDTTRQGVEEGRIEVITETQLWQRLGLVETEQHIRRLYTPAMLADLLNVPLAVVRRWHRRGLIVPTREVRRLPYFDFQEVATARRLADLLATGMSPQTIEKKLAELARYVPNVQRPLAQLSIIVEGKHLLLRQGEGLVAPGGQLWFDFQPREPGQDDPAADATAVADGAATASDGPAAILPLVPLASAAATSPEDILARAAGLEDEGELNAAVEMYRTALAVGGPNAKTCFTLAELLYRLGDVKAARERYFMTLELDEEYVEARANLGCVLAELGERELAVAAFQGALAFHDEYPDVHYHLARTLDDLGRRLEADLHWQAFLDLAPESPWAATARMRLSAAPN